MNRPVLLSVAFAASAMGAPAWAADPIESFQLPRIGDAAPAAQVNAVFDHVNFQGNQALSTATLSAIAAPYLGRALGADDLETLRQKLTRAYVDRGYVNSGVLRGSATATGTLNFLIIEGRLAEVRLHGMERLHDAYVSARLQREEDGALNLDQLRNRFQLLLTDPLFVRMNARLLPAEKPGEAIMDIEVQRARPWELSAYVNNYRPVSIGAEQMGLRGLVRNLTGRGDLLEASVQLPFHAGAGKHGSLGWTLPLGRLTNVSVALEGGSASVIEEPVKVLDIRSTVVSGELGLNHTFIETLSQRLTLGLNWEHRENRTSLLGQPYSFTLGDATGEIRESLWKFWQDYNWRSEKQVLSLRSTFTFGSNSLQEVAGLPALAGPARRFQFWTGQLRYGRQVMDNGAQLVLRATVQQSRDRLLSLDGLSLGGVSSVRGYRENQLIRDEGLYLNLEFEYPAIANSASGMRLTLIPFYDFGRARNRGDESTMLSSCGLAGRAQWRDFSLDLAIAKRLGHSASVQRAGSNLQDEGIHLQASYSF